MVIMRRDIESNSLTANITLQEKVKRLEHELDNEKQKSRQLEADLSILVRGRKAEISYLNDIIVSLQNKLEASEALNQPPRFGINYPNVINLTISDQNSNNST
jgi:predicted  nucleic acid-binding Zn-ribbon protein